MLALLLVIGAFAGLIAGLLGVGGGIVLVPCYFFMFIHLGYDTTQLMQICLATSLATIVVTSLRSVLAHHRRGAVDWTTLRGWAPWIASGAIAGLFAASGLRSDTLVLIFVVLSLAVGAFLGLGRPHWRLGKSMPGGLRRAVMAPAMGFLSVLMGIGGGSFGVPVMTLYGVPIHRAVATSAGFGLIIAAPSVIGFLMIAAPEDGRPPFTIGHVNLPAFAVTVSMTLLTAPLGARLAHMIDAARLRRIFAVFIVLMALNMLRRVIWG